MGLGKQFRLGKHSRYTLVYKSGTRTECQFFTLYHFFPQDRNTGKRFGFAVTRKVGNAVIRNRTRRQLQEAIRSLQAEIIEPLDVVLIAKPGSTARSFEDIIEALRKCLKKKKLLQESPENKPEP